MIYKDLLAQSKARINTNPGNITGAISWDVFSTGAKWVCEKMNETGSKKVRLSEATNFGSYGLLKYGTCIVIFLITATVLYKIDIFLTPLSILVFYFCEVQLLFLFPLLIDQVKQPLWVSVQQTWRIGPLRAMCTVIPISIFMLAGLFSNKSRLRNWYIGSLAIIIWYQHEVSNKIR